MKKHVVLRKKSFAKFIAALAAKQKIVAPVSKGYGRYAFDQVTSAEQISLDYIPTILPPKKYFMPQYETLATYDTTKGQNMVPKMEHETLVLFGVHTCDLAGIQCLDLVFKVEPKDDNYLKRKDKIFIIGYGCNTYCDEYASCKLADAHTPNGGYDLFFTDLGDRFMVQVNSEAGEKMVSSLKVFNKAKDVDLTVWEELQAKKRTIFAKNEVAIEAKKIPALFDKTYNSQVWQELEARCLACGNCTAVCPTCYCFDVIDEPNLDLKTGKRYRRWDSCQNEEFAKVAGGESFRSKRGARQRHRYYRKFKYPAQKFSRLFCTGCGRCSRTCMANINLKETLSALVKEQLAALATSIQKG